MSWTTLKKRLFSPPTKVDWVIVLVFPLAFVVPIGAAVVYVVLTMPSPDPMQFTRETFQDEAIVLMGESLAIIQLQDGHLPSESPEGLATLSRYAHEAENWFKRFESNESATNTPGYFKVNYEYALPPSGRIDRLSEETIVLSQKIPGSRNGPIRFITSRGFAYYGDLMPTMPPRITSLVRHSLSEVQGSAVSVRQRRTASSRLIDEEDSALSRICASLLRYERDHGHLPYEARGPEYALYQLRPVLPDSPSTEEPSPLEWDDKAGIARDLRYDYVNRPDLRLIGGDEDPFVVLAEKVTISRDCPIFLLTSTGARIFGIVSTDRLGNTSSLAGLPASQAKIFLSEILRTWRIDSPDVVALKANRLH